MTRGTGIKAATLLDLAGVIYSVGKVFDGLECDRSDVERFLRTGRLDHLAAPHDRALLADLNDVAQHVLEATQAASDFQVDAAFVITLNAGIARSGALQPGRLRTAEQPIGVSTARERHEPPALTAEDLEQLIRASTAGKASADTAIELFIELARAQPFMDGNKRAAVFAANAVLLAANDQQLLTVPLDDDDPGVARAFNDALALAYVEGDRAPVAAMLRERGLQDLKG